MEVTKRSTPLKKWIGEIPTKCDLCGHDLVNVFVDGRMLTAHSWAVMCSSCFELFGAGIGPGYGQLYNTRGEKLEG